LNRRPRLHYYSDCDFFGGCENMIANFLNDQRVSEEFEVTFGYRRTDRYESGLRKRTKFRSSFEHYRVLPHTMFTQMVVGKPKPLNVLVRGLDYLLGVRYWVFVWNVFVLYRAWKDRKIDILHINNGGYPAAVSCLAAAVAARLARIDRVVMVVNNIAKQKRYRYWWLDRAIDFFVKRKVSIFVTGSLSASQALRTVLRLPDPRFLTLYNGIAKRETTELASVTRARLGVSGNALVFGMVALLEWRKGHRVLFHAIARLRELVAEHELPIFLIEGEGPDKEILHDLVMKLGVGNWVRFVGAERHIFNFMQALDVMLLPSVANEDFPNVILEAMSLGKPVIASRIAGTPEQIEDGVTGTLVAPGDDQALALAIASFIRNKDSLADMGRQARARFDKEFTAEVAVSRYMNLYQKLINRREN
jgi:glycosyltransferase involved in cell wall biosynthesis